MLAIDPYSLYGLRQFAVPFASGWREPWTGLGVIALWLVLVVGATSSYRTRIGQRAFRLVHWLAFPLYLTALAHGVGAGTDTGLPWTQGLYVISASVVAWMLGVRLLRGPRDRQRTARAGQGGR
jgi:sulfoxide reductase heme-binding subunit YedZ